MLTFADPVVEELFAAQHSRDSINVSSLHHLLTVISWLAQIRNDNQLPGMRAAGVAVGGLMILQDVMAAGYLILAHQQHSRHEQVKCWSFILEAMGLMVHICLINPRKALNNLSVTPAVVHMLSACFDQVRFKYMVNLCACNTVFFANCQAQAAMARQPVHCWSAVLRDTCIFALAGCALPLAICWQGERRKRQAFLVKHQTALINRGFDMAAMTS